jgi:hypothetical protein
MIDLNNCTKTQMTLGSLIDRLESLPSDTMIEAIEFPHSYRGYYTDLAFELASANITVASALALCRECLDRIFDGYKGGDYYMHRHTPVWIANYDSGGGRKLVALNDDGRFVLAEDN